jgi:hypothetical protein
MTQGGKCRTGWPSDGSGVAHTAFRPYPRRTVLGLVLFIMTLADIVAAFLAVRAERRTLEEIADPLSA